MLSVPAWLIVLIGLLLNISATLVTHFIIDNKLKEVNQLSFQVSDNNKEMELLWLQIAGIERKRETLYLLLNQDRLQPVIAKQFRLLLESHLQQTILLTDLSNINFLEVKINEYQKNRRNQIDNKFFLNLELGELKASLNTEISRLRNGSIFLQMIGLSLILARDLSRKRLATE